MNLQLREAIVKHVLASFAIIPSTHVALHKSKSLKSKEFLLTDKVSFIGPNNEVIENKVWGCQFAAEQQELKILLADCSIDSNIPEYAVLISLKNQPIYGVYLVDANDIDTEALIAVSMNGKEWMECSTFLQATFLAGMENIKELGFSWSKPNSYRDQLISLLSFIKYHTNLYGETNEG